MRKLSAAFAFVVAISLSGKALAAEKVAAKTPHAAAWQAPAWLKGLNLTESQKTTVQSIEKEFAEKRQELIKKIHGSLSDEQKKALAEARAKAKADGKSGSGMATLRAQLTDQQKAGIDAAKKEMAGLNTQMRERIISTLTPEQQAKLKPASHGSQKK